MRCLRSNLAGRLITNTRSKKSSSRHEVRSVAASSRPSWSAAVLRMRAVAASADDAPPQFTTHGGMRVGVSHYCVAVARARAADAQIEPRRRALRVRVVDGADGLLEVGQRGGRVVTVEEQGLAAARAGREERAPHARERVDGVGLLFQ